MSILVSVEATSAHPERDVALVELAPAPELEELPTLPVITREEDFALGALVQLAGYGDTPEAPASAPTFAVEEIVALDGDAVLVSGFGFSGACQADSGGPLLSRAEDGQIRVSALLSNGHVSCRAEDRYTRLDTVLAWLADGTAGGSASSSDCDGTSATGRCYGDLAVHCDAGVLTAERCTAPLSCGYSLAERGYRCVDAQADPCHGVDDLGTCDGARVVRCEAGELVTSDCGVCGGECVRSPKTGETTCYL